MVAPNWLGVVPQNIAIAQKHASDGYVVFVPDMFGVGKDREGTENPMEFLAPFIEDVAGTRRAIVGAFDAMTAAAARRGIGDGKRRAAIGYCLRRRQRARSWRARAPTSPRWCRSTACWRPRSPRQKAASRPMCLVLHGAADPVSPKAHRDMFEAEMDAAGARWMLLNFGGVVHAYTDPQANFLPVAKYDEPASRYTQAMLDAFIADAFQRQALKHGAAEPQ